MPTLLKCISVYAKLAKEFRFDEFEVAALTTAASELSRNVWVHARRVLLVSLLCTVGRRLVSNWSLSIMAGIADLNRGLAGGLSTQGHWDSACPAPDDWSNEISVSTKVGRGTKRIVVREWKKEF